MEPSEYTRRVVAAAGMKYEEEYSVRTQPNSFELLERGMKLAVETAEAYRARDLHPAGWTDAARSLSVFLLEVPACIGAAVIHLVTRDRRVRLFDMSTEVGVDCLEALRAKYADVLKGAIEGDCRHLIRDGCAGDGN